ncbi:phage tail family protein [Lysinibacillus sp. A4]|uniref:phage tail family protein n=1 Tax=Lysinibacillus sp. A4 TaxID=2976269 RepID=UPI0021757C93|nr:phage tail family protein [Lysinibacillus sp. A4]MCS5499799.1 phage tail family protein [Lysinibacillus sp. A4]
MIIKDMTIINNRGDSLVFGRHFFIREDFAISGLGAKVNMAETTSDGAHYQSTTLETRDIEVPFYIQKTNQDPWWIEEKRQEVYRVCNPKFNPMRIDFSTNSGDQFYVNANLTTAPLFGQGRENDNRRWVTGLLQFISSDPFIYEAASRKVDIALWESNLEFPLEVVEEGIEIGYCNPSLIVNVLNEGSESTGMSIRFLALSEVVNPKLLNVNTYEAFNLNYTMLPGDVIEVSTYKGKRSIILIRNNEQSNIFNALDFNTSKFLQLEPGDNLLRYDASSGLDFLEVSVEFTPKRIGV